MTVQSSHGGRSLAIASDVEARDYWFAELQGGGFRATWRFYAYDHTGLGQYFAELAAAWRGWDGDKTWEALEGDVRIAASHDGKGTVAMLVELRAEPTVRRDPDWCASVVLTLDAGGLDRLARAARDGR